MLHSGKTLFITHCSIINEKQGFLKLPESISQEGKVPHDTPTTDLFFFSPTQSLNYMIKYKV